MGHLNGIMARVGGNLNENFQNSQMPGGLLGRGGGAGAMLRLRFDRYIITLEFFFLLFEKNGSVGDGKRNIFLGLPNLETV